MHPVGTIIYFTPFYFSDGKSAPKNKYFIVLARAGDDLIIASLPSSVDRVPERVVQEHGCVQIPEAMFSAYIFEAGRPVTAQGWGFPLTTYVYIAWIQEFEARIFRSVYSVENVDYTVIGRLVRKEYEALLHCARTSGELKKRYRKALQDARY